jgi:polyphosphate kinase
MNNEEEMVRRIYLDLRDDFDEELEMDDRPFQAVTESEGETCAQLARADRQAYFRNLFKLQSELVKYKIGL